MSTVGVGIILVIFFLLGRPPLLGWSLLWRSLLRSLLLRSSRLLGILALWRLGGLTLRGRGILIFLLRRSWLQGRFWLGRSLLLPASFLQLHVATGLLTLIPSLLLPFLIRLFQASQADMSDHIHKLRFNFFVLGRYHFHGFQLLGDNVLVVQ